MSIKLFIGSEQADFNEVFNVVFSIGDIRELGFGNNNKTYTLNLPLTKTNKRLLSFINQADVKSEVSSKAWLFLGDLLIIRGALQVLSLNDTVASVIINSDDWMDNLKNKKLSELDLSAHDHILNHANVEDSWTAAYPFYRYPMINFGALASGETGTTAKWNPNDFVPMFQVTDLITHILTPYTIISTHLAVNAIKDLYILARETIAPDSYIEGKNLEVRVQNVTDNEDSVVIGSGNTETAQITALQAKFNDIITDQGSDWGGFNDTYTIPEAGTYRFIVTLVLRNTAYGNADLTILDESYTLRILKTSGVTVTELASLTSAAYTGTELLHAVTYSLDSKYVHFAAGDTFTVEISCMCQATNNGLVNETVAIGTAITASKVINIWNNVCKYAGLTKNIEAEKLLPDMSQLDFLAAVRDIFNLRFWMDKQKQNIYIEPWDSFLSATVVDLSAYVDYSSIDTELISKSYSKITELKWKDDSQDKAYQEYLKTAVSPGMKDITLTSVYTKPGTEVREHPFSSVITGNNITIASILAVPRIWADVIDTAPVLFNRLANFNTRIVEWKGLTAGLTWYYEGDTKNTYPKVQGLDFATIYSSYLQKFYHYIDKGKIFTVKMKVKPGMLTEFLTVVNIATSEAFRPTYKINIAGTDNYFFLQKLVSDGIRCELELILKT